MKREWSVHPAGAIVASVAVASTLEPQTFPESSGASQVGETIVLEWRDVQGLPAHTAAELIQRGARCIVVSSPDAPPNGALVSVRDGQSVYRATVHGLRQVGVQTHFELRYVDDGRRRQERLAAGGQARISWDSGGRSRVSFEAEVMNVSEGGLQLLSSREAPVGVYVQIAGRTTKCVGKTRYCRSSLDGYLIGVEFIRSPAA